ncbi:MAG TPA: ABC transporter ATP-binding protein [Chloroflexi bacterium]|jgi:branched-chain amino acid transport system ATP-binding protein|nr:ABC transporter ATP-binding protein [Chloroflexota bacterium]
MTKEPILQLDGVTVQFGGLVAINEVDMHLSQGEFIGLIGPNGAGKTTLFNIITGSVHPTRGRVLFKGDSIVGRSSDALCHLGISRTFQNIRLFPQMTAFENVALGLHSRPHYSILEAFVRSPRALRAERQMRERAMGLLSMVGLADYAENRAGNLPYGLQRRLELARAMATSPELLLLDEPAAGMNEDECDEMVTIISRIHREMGYSVILIEHHMNVVMELCRDSRIYVLNLGEILAEGYPQDIQNDPRVIDAYLGQKKERYASRR